ncbi:MAG: class I SAM-dependent methyltransferase [Ardenticatenaceae bacterium]
MRSHVVQQLSAPGGGSLLQVASVVERENLQPEEILRGTVLSAEQGLFWIREGVLDLLPEGAGELSRAQQSNLLWPTAQFYERPWRSNTLSVFSGEPFGFERERTIFNEMLGQVEGGLWLDLAASTALYGRWLADRLAERERSFEEGHSGEVVVLDYAWPMLRRARHFVSQEGHSNISFVMARGEALPFATGTLDGVVCGGSLNEFGTQKVSLVLREVARALRDGGVALFMHLLTAEKGIGQRLQRYVAAPGGIAFWNRQQTNQLFEQAGLVIDQMRDFGVVGFTRLRRRT